ncbi:MAG: hypothetical protein JJU42_15820, partial [Rhodobacteraceae bacterium]|nr:hypothetical protein [Paracoccaceae bacterium]
LQGLTSLQTLRLDSTQVSDLAPLQGLTSLQTLRLDSTQVSDLAPLQSLTNLQTLSFGGTQVSDIAPLQSLTGLKSLGLGAKVSDLAPLQSLTGLQSLGLGGTHSDLTPLQSLTGLQSLSLGGTQVSDLAPLQGLSNLLFLNIENTQVSDLRPIAWLNQLASDDSKAGLFFRNTEATKRDARLARLADDMDDEGTGLARPVLHYLRSLPPWPDPYTPAATPDGSPPQPIGGESIGAQAQALSDLTPLAEELVQNPETGRFSVNYKPIEKPDLLAATLGQVGDAIEDVLQDPSNGLNEKSLDIRKLKRTLERYANDPQRVEMDFTTVHQSLTRQIAIGELPPSEENLALISAVEQGAQGIRATHADVAVNRRILQEQRLRELTTDAVATIREKAPIVQAITEGDMAEQSAEDVDYLTNVLPSAPPRLPGVTRNDAIVQGRDEAVRLFGRSSRMLIMLRKSGDLVQKLHQSTGYKAAEIMQALIEFVKLGHSLFM